MLLIDKINENIKDFNLTLTLESADFKKSLRALDIYFSYPDGFMLSKEIKTVVENTIKQEFGDGITISIKYRKNYFDEDILASFIMDKLKKEYPMVGLKREHIVYNSDEKKVTLSIDNSVKEFIEKSNLSEFIEKEIAGEYKQELLVVLDYKDNLVKVDNTPENFDFTLGTTSDDYEIELESMEPYIGEKIDAPIYPIATYITPSDGITVCGKIENLVESETKPKVDENGKEHASKTYFTFELVDFSGRLRVVYFPGKANTPKFKKLANGSEIAIFGNLEDDKFSAGLSLRPKVINLIITKPNFYTQIYSLPVPRTYKKVFPEPYIATEQEDLFNPDTEIKSEYLLGNDFVVFDLETTGVNYTQDKIIEIGAVKIKNGKLTETFGTLINPECHIPADATKVNNITDDDVKDAPKLKEIMPDFFKFCDGCVMVSYVIGFDFSFIEYYGKKLGYAWTHETDDAFVMAKTKLKGLKNYKLVTVAKALNVPLETAHRAVFDAVAAAEVMIKLCEKF